MKLTDILPLEKWMAFEKDLHDRSGLDVNAFNTDGIRITTYKEWVNRLCPVVKDHDKGQAFICAVAHMNIAAMANQTGKPAIEECDAGLLKLVVPIFVDGEFVGSVGACGLLLDDGEVDAFMINKTIEVDETEIEHLSDDIGQISSSDAEDLAKYIITRIDEILAQYKKNA